MKKIRSNGGELPPIWKKRLRIMKLTFLFLMIGLMHVSASVYSQSTKLTLEMRNKKVVEVLDEIEKQSEFRFAYSSELIDINRKVSVNINDKKIERTLDVIFEGTGVSYVLQDRHIMLYPEKMDGKVNADGVQQKTISGKVSDEAGEPLPGVTVIIRGTTNGTVTNMDGNYSISNVPEDATLQFSFIGMKTQEVVVGNNTSIDVTMLVDAIGLEEVVAIGYGTMSKSDLTGSVVKADIEAFKESPNVNLLQSLQGSTPGLNIGMVDEAGGTPSMSIRGTTTISGNRSVLIVVDGIIYNGSVSDFNPSDIESVDILKDASSKSIYGAQAANGVILITTKTGTKNKKPFITYSTSYTTVEPTHLLEMYDREGFLQRARDIFYKDAYTEESGYTKENPDFDIETALSSPENVVGYRNGYDTDWYDLATNKGNMQHHHLSINGVTDKVTYYISGGYDKQKNWIVNDHFNRKTVRINIKTDINDWLQVGAQTFGSFSDYSGGSPNWQNILKSGPLRSPYLENGDLLYRFESWENPLVSTVREDNDKINSLFGNFFGIVKIPSIPGLTYTINYGNNLRWRNNYYFNSFGQSQSGDARKVNSSAYEYTVDNIINYKKILNKVHNFDLTLVAGVRERQYESTDAYAYNFANKTLGSNDLSQGVEQFTYSGSSEESSLYQMGRLNYSFDNRYLITATIRRDGFSGFAENEKTALFPSVAIGWTASQEEFMSGIDWLDNLKLRASWGENGNLVNSYSSLARTRSYGAYVFGDGGTTAFGHYPTSLPSPNLRWEKTSGINIGLDYAILGGIVNGSIEYYKTKTNDLIWNQSIPSITGFNSIIGNIGEINNTGLELLINSSLVNINDIRWDLNFSLSTNKNEVAHLLGDRDGDGIEDDLISSGLFIGESLGAIYTYEIDGIYQLDDEVPAGYQVGGYRVKDNNEDGLFTADDRRIIGKTEPAYRFSIQNSIGYKNFTFKVFLNSIQGGKNGYLARNEPYLNDTRNNIAKGGSYVDIDSWTPSNPDAEYMIGGAAGAINPVHYMDRSFVRLQDISLSYDLDKNIASKWGIGGLKLFVSGKNLYTWTKWKGWDPETASGFQLGAKPVMKNYSLGLELIF